MNVTQASPLTPKKAAPWFLLRPRAVVRFLGSKQAPLLPKLGILAAIAYFVLPFDAVPDVVPLLGWLDDVGILAMAIAWLGQQVARHEAATSAESPAAR